MDRLPVPREVAPHLGVEIAVVAVEARQLLDLHPGVGEVVDERRDEERQEDEDTAHVEAVEDGVGGHAHTAVRHRHRASGRRLEDDGARRCNRERVSALVAVGGEVPGLVGGHGDGCAVRRRRGCVVEDVVPPVPRSRLEEGEHGADDVAEVEVVVDGDAVAHVAQQHDVAADGAEEEDPDAHEEQRGEDRGAGAQQRRDHDLEHRDAPDELEDAQNSEGLEDAEVDEGEGVVHERHDDDDEVEGVPHVLEERARELRGQGGQRDKLVDPLGQDVGLPLELGLEDAVGVALEREVDHVDDQEGHLHHGRDGEVTGLAGVVVRAHPHGVEHDDPGHEHLVHIVPQHRPDLLLGRGCDGRRLARPLEAAQRDARRDPHALCLRVERRPRLPSDVVDEHPDHELGDEGVADEDEEDGQDHVLAHIVLRGLAGHDVDGGARGAAVVRGAAVAAADALKGAGGVHEALEDDVHVVRGE
mmetsp:Transcript_54448/g.143825  ORF Transcript_54448/g.143825 Transcript_54448/m.143825 type:complete len:473 (-) Transcript_54448:231-1649(-)